VIHADALKLRAQTLQGIAYKESLGNNRAVGDLGHQATVDYIYDELMQLTEYYTVELQPIIMQQNKAELMANGEDIYASFVIGSPLGEGYGFLAVVPNQGCDEVSSSIRL
jgi:hypothetical protein